MYANTIFCKIIIAKLSVIYLLSLWIASAFETISSSLSWHCADSLPSTLQLTGYEIWLTIIFNTEQLPSDKRNSKG